MKEISQKSKNNKTKGGAEGGALLFLYFCLIFFIYFADFWQIFLADWAPSRFSPHIWLVHGGFIYDPLAAWCPIGY